jgi:hypothetical protein
LCFLILFSMIGFGIYVDGYGINHPEQLNGVCPPPAQIRGNNCQLITKAVVVTSGTATTITSTEQAGTIVNIQTTVTKTITSTINGTG